MLLMCATGSINNLPFRGIIQFMAIHQGVAFELKLIALLGADLQICKFATTTAGCQIIT